jgi:hypothetical protein
MRDIRELIPNRFYLFNYPRLFVSIGVTLAVAFIIYTTLFGRVW